MAKENAGVSQGSAAGHVGGHCAQGMKPLRGAANQQQGANAALGGDGAAGQDAQAWYCGQCGDGDEADVGFARGQLGGAFGGRHAVNLIAECEWGLKGRVLEVPHQRRGVQKADGGNAQTGLRPNIHTFIDYQVGVKDAELRPLGERSWLDFF